MTDLTFSVSVPGAQQSADQLEKVGAAATKAAVSEEKLAGAGRVAAGGLRETAGAATQATQAQTKQTQATEQQTQANERQTRSLMELRNALRGEAQERERAARAGGGGGGGGGGTRPAAGGQPLGERGGRFLRAGAGLGMSVATMAGGAMSASGQSEIGSVINDAILGGMVGAAFGPIGAVVGAGIMAIGGAITRKIQGTMEKAKEEAEKAAQAMDADVQDRMARFRRDLSELRATRDARKSDVEAWKSEALRFGPQLALEAAGGKDAVRAADKFSMSTGRGLQDTQATLAALLRSGQTIPGAYNIMRAANINETIGRMPFAEGIGVGAGVGFQTAEQMPTLDLASRMLNARAEADHNERQAKLRATLAEQYLASKKAREDAIAASAAAIAPGMVAMMAERGAVNPEQAAMVAARARAEREAPTLARWRYTPEAFAPLAGTLPEDLMRQQFRAETSPSGMLMSEVMKERERRFQSGRNDAIGSLQWSTLLPNPSALGPNEKTLLDQRREAALADMQANAIAIMEPRKMTAEAKNEASRAFMDARERYLKAGGDVMIANHVLRVEVVNMPPTLTPVGGY